MHAWGDEQTRLTHHPKTDGSVARPTACPKARGTPTENISGPFLMAPGSARRPDCAAESRPPIFFCVYRGCIGVDAGCWRWCGLWVLVCALCLSSCGVSWKQ